MATKPTVKKEAPRTYIRFALAQRVEHVFMLLSFATLGFTGLPQKYATHPAAVAFVDFLGGIENLRAIHHLAAAVMMLGTIYHILIVGYKIFVERRRMTMLPVFQDAKDALGAFVYNLGFRKSRPQMGRYTFEEKAEYWAFVWGAVVMGFTGFLMWNPVTTAKFLPGEFIPAAKAAHGGEALLAVLAIIVWHMYGVHIKSFNKAMWTGRMTEDEMLHEHPLELADIKAGVADRTVDAVTLRKRQRIYFPVAAILTVVMLAGVYGFTTAENTALTTIPPQPQAIQVFAPQTPTPIPTPMPTATRATTSSSSTNPTWDSVIGALFASKCTSCHGAAATAGLNLASYATAIQGGVSGPWFVAGDSANSLLVTKFASGGHSYEVLLEDEFALIKAWIDAGALEK